MTVFGDRVREARQRIRTAGGGRLTQGDLAAAVGVERNTVSRWENSGVSPKDPQVVRRLASVLQVSMEWLCAEGEAQAGAQAVATGAPADRVSQVASAASEIVAYRMPPVAYERVHTYIERVERAGATVTQAEEVARVLVDAASTPLRSLPPRDRPVHVVLADVDAAWRYATTVLRGEGLAIEGSQLIADVPQAPGLADQEPLDTR